MNIGMKTAGVVSLLIMMTMTGCMSSPRDEKEKIPPAKLSYAKEITLTPEQFWHDKQLKDSFSAYWSLRAAKKSAELFKTEAPYFQTTANFDRYRGVVDNLNGEITEVELRERTDVTARLVRIKCMIRLRGSDGEKNIPMLDEWVYVGEKWYHVWRDHLLFPNES